MPTNAIALPRVFRSDTSVMIAMLNEMFPLLRPPTKRASTNRKKFDDMAQRIYEHEIPNWKLKINKMSDKYRNVRNEKQWHATHQTKQ